MSDLASIHAIVSGRVQGVFFRAFVSRQAVNLKITGFARNMPDRTVEVHAEGEREKLEELIRRLKVGPTRAHVKNVVTEWSDYSGEFSQFRIKN